MTKDRLWRFLKSIAVPLALALILALLVRDFFLNSLEFPNPSRVEALKRDKPAQIANQSGTSNAQDSFLSDSIISIIQSYYVDQERVENKKLLKTALASLANNLRVKSGVDSSHVWVEIDGSRRDFYFDDEARYADLVELIVDVGQFIDQHGIVIDSTDARDKTASGSIKLLNSMLGQLDPHSSLLSPDAYKELRQGTEGSFGGLGVLVSMKEHLLTVIKPIPRSPAQRAGIRRNDRILSIDGTMTFGYSLDDLVEHMRGDPGSEVQLSLLREGAFAPAELALKREVIQVDSVTVKEIEKTGANYLHLTIDSFSSKTSREVMSAIQKTRKRFGGTLSGLILDLRSNPGGLLDQAVQVADLFLQKGVIVTTKGRREEVENAGSGFDEISFPMVVLIDPESASASEIVAGALQDHGRAVVVGQPSFGKGSVQTVFELPGDRALKLTIARYFTPDGRSIQNTGIMPDIWLQPIFVRDHNQNLFGDYRYKNERFLRNHLEVLPKDSADQKLRVPARKAYYLSDSTDEKLDREMEIALVILEKMHQVYGNQLPASAQRSSHWLGMAGPLVAKKASDLENESQDFLSKRFNVSWNVTDFNQLNSELVFSIADSSVEETQAGSRLEVAWQIFNPNSVPVERISVYARSEMSGFETVEVLVGKLGQKTTKTGRLSIPIPPTIEAGFINLRVGAAMDAWPIASAVVDKVIEIKPRVESKLKVEATLSREFGGKILGVVEPKEKAELLLTLSNMGSFDVGEISAKIVNLAGAQVQIKESEIKIPGIAAGTEREVRFSLRASKTLLVDNLKFGFVVDAKELSQPIRKPFAVKARVNGELSSKSSATMSH